MEEKKKSYVTKYYYRNIEIQKADGQTVKIPLKDAKVSITFSRGVFHEDEILADIKKAYGDASGVGA